MRLVIDAFGGLMPKMDPTKLPDGAAQESMDTRLNRGILRGWRKPLSLTPKIQSIANVQTIFWDEGSSVWYQWTNDVNIVPGMVADLTAVHRYYYTGAGDGTPKKTSSAIGITGSGTYPQVYYKMGAKAPTTAMTFTNDGLGTGTAEDHVYVYTNVFTFEGVEEESAPSPITTVAAWQPGDAITLTLPAMSTPSGYTTLTTRRIYRSNGGSYFYVGATTSTSFIDNLLNDALGEEIPSMDWDEPPTALQGLVALANGSFSGFVGNEIYFSEPYQPHAWPRKYSLTVSEQIVALVSVAQGMYVLTTGTPYFCTGTYPDSMTLERAPKYYPCLSKRSAATDGIGVIYATYNGLAYMTGANVSLMTEQLFTQEDWEAYTPYTALAVFYDERYHYWYGGADDEKGFVFDKTMPGSPLTATRLNAKAAVARPDTGSLYIVTGGEIKQFDADPANFYRFTWKSRAFLLPHPVNFGYAEVHLSDYASSYEDEAEAIAANNDAAWNGTVTNAAPLWSGAWNDHEINTWEVNGSGLLGGVSVDKRGATFQVYAGGELKYSKYIQEDSVLRLPGGFKSDTWEIKVSGNLGVRRVVLANTAKELATA